MDKSRIATITAAIGVLSALLALDWSRFMLALAGVPELIQRWSAGLPAGAWSALLGLVLSMGAWGATYLHPRAVCTHKPHSCADTFALVIGFLVVVSQQAVTDHSPASLLTAMWIGITVGLAGMYLARLLWSVLSPPKEPKP